MEVESQVKAPKAEGASYMRYELVEKKGEKVIMPVRYSIRRNDPKANVSMDQSFHTCEALAGKVGASME
jgi:hypothetical protein